MNRHAFRSVSRRTRPAEVDHATQTLSSYFRQFSSSAQLRADEPNPTRPNLSARQQSRAAADDIRVLAGNAGARQPAQQTDANAQQPRVVDVKSLPRGGLRGRGGFRGAGGFRGRGGAPGGAGGRGGAANRFSGSRGAFRGRGQARGRGRGGKAGKDRKKGEEDEQDEGRNRRQPTLEEADIVEPSQQAFADAMRFGVSTTYTPSVTLESLAVHMPNVASGASTGFAAVHESLSTLGTADRVGVRSELPAAMYALDLKETGMRYFSSVEDKERTEAFLQQKRREQAEAKADGGAPVEVSSERIIGDAEDAIKKVILDEAVAGQHQAPTFTTDPVSTSRNWHLRAETWGAKETKAFEDKLKGLLEKGKARQKAKA